eukprot:2337867-Pleurochrysis_carterae.AAC.1
MGDLCREYRVKKNTRIMQEYSNVKRLHRIQLQVVEQGALGVIWGRHKREILGAQTETQVNERENKVTGAIEKRQTARCWGGGRVPA